MSDQCHCLTMKGERCKNKVTIGEFCRVHQNCENICCNENNISPSRQISQNRSRSPTRQTTQNIKQSPIRNKSPINNISLSRQITQNKSRSPTRQITQNVKQSSIRNKLPVNKSSNNIITLVESDDKLNIEGITNESKYSNLRDYLKKLGGRWNGTNKYWYIDIINYENIINFITNEGIEYKYEDEDEDEYTEEQKEKSIYNLTKTDIIIKGITLNTEHKNLKDYIKKLNGKWSKTNQYWTINIGDLENLENYMINEGYDYDYDYDNGKITLKNNPNIKFVNIGENTYIHGISYKKEYDQLRNEMKKLGASWDPYKICWNIVSDDKDKFIKLFNEYNLEYENSKNNNLCKGKLILKKTDNLIHVYKMPQNLTDEFKKIATYRYGYWSIDTKNLGNIKQMCNTCKFINKGNYTHIYGVGYTNNSIMNYLNSQGGKKTQSHYTIDIKDENILIIFMNKYGLNYEYKNDYDTSENK